MADVMVTARMTQAKKREGNSILKELGLSASQAINQFYDYLIAHKETPFKEKQPQAEVEIEAKRLALRQALEFVESIPKTSRFSTMTDDEIKRERLAAKGLYPLEPGRGDE